ncbi:MAG: hypothetical protein MJZ00_06690 [Paludibacteraceae bacterium]|nr:hypothetical protein [Paludibacteraceae bacterium]
MKTNFFYTVKTLCYAAMAMSAVSFASCSKDNDDDDDYVYEKTAKQQSLLTVKLTEDHFEYGDFIVTLEYDGIKHEYKMSEMPRMNDDLNVQGGSFDCRVLSVPEFEHNTPVNLYSKFELNEAGRQKIANANENDEVTGFGLQVNFLSTAPGKNGNYSLTTRPNTWPLNTLDKFFETRTDLISNNK